MAKVPIKINSILEGQSPSRYYGIDGTFDQSIAIDPDFPIDGTSIRTSGFAVPIGTSKFSTSVNASVVSIINNPKDTNTYVVLSNGRFISYDANLASETIIANTFTVTIASPAVFTVTSHGLSANDIVYFWTTGALPTGLTAGTAYYVISAGLSTNAFEVSATKGGAAINTSGTQSGTHTITMDTQSGVYYNNYIYLFTGTNVSRYGPLNNSPVLTFNVWQGATLGTQTALSNTGYPSIRGVSIPNHIGHVHGDNSLYFTDFVTTGTTAAGQGVVHRISTKKVTNEGDTNGTTVPSLYNALDLPLGFYPTAIESFSTSLMILGNYSNDGGVNQGRGAFVLWDPTNTNTFYLGPVFLEDPIATALLNVNGRVFIWSGNGQNGFRLTKYGGGESVSDVALFEEGVPPFATAVDAIGNKVIWGGFTTTPSVTACVWSYGSKDVRLPTGIQNIMKTTSAGASPIVTALKYVQQSSNIQPKAIVAWKDASSQGIDQYSATGTLASYLRWTFNVGQRFNIMRIRIPFGGAVAANTTITPTVYFDDLSSSQTLTTINNTNFPASRKVIYKAPELKNFVGENNFTLELAWTGTNPLPVALPINITLDVKEDEPDK